MSIKIKKLKKVIIKKSKWLHGHNKTTRYQRNDELTDSCLLDDEGYMCCLGQWCEQIGVPKAKLECTSTPQELMIIIPLLTNQNGDDTPFARKMMKLNDSCKQSSTAQEKELTKLAKSKGVKLVFVD